MSVENDKKIEDSFRAIEKEFQEKFIGHMLTRILEKVNERMLVVSYRV